MDGWTEQRLIDRYVGRYREYGFRRMTDGSGLRGLPADGCLETLERQVNG